MFSPILRAQTDCLLCPHSHPIEWNKECLEIDAQKLRKTAYEQVSAFDMGPFFLAFVIGYFFFSPPASYIICLQIVGKLCMSSPIWTLAISSDLLLKCCHPRPSFEFICIYNKWINQFQSKLEHKSNPSRNIRWAQNRSQWLSKCFLLQVAGRF